jgi:hypothetical protein
MKIRRNSLCPCGSGKKSKKCCGSLEMQQLPARELPIARIAKQMAAAEQIRQQQQGLGRPLVSFDFSGRRIVAVANTLHWSDAGKWKTFPDFLADYIKKQIGPEWGTAELAKPHADRHVLLQWYETFCRYQQAHAKKQGEMFQAEMNGVVMCYLGLAYNLFLLEHNVELQTRLIKRLKNLGNFQGAYFELIVAGILIRAGFELVLEDEADPSRRHCEFAAKSKTTGKMFTVEAKMRVVPGVFLPAKPGERENPNPLSRLIPQLNDALDKPSQHERLIFIDLNAEVSAGGQYPEWTEAAVKRLERYERDELASEKCAYVFVTNFPFHRDLLGRIQMQALPFGVGIPDFNRPVSLPLIEMYRRRQKHIDAFNIVEFMHLQIPMTFDGSLESEAFGGLQRAKIGDTHNFPDVNGGEFQGTISCATVNETACEAIYAVLGADGQTRLITEKMAPQQVAEYALHKESYFGETKAPMVRKPKDPLAWFEWFLDTYRHTPRQKLEEWLQGAIPPDQLAKMTDEEMALFYCEGLTASVIARSEQKETT